MARALAACPIPGIHGIEPIVDYPGRWAERAQAASLRGSFAFMKFNCSPKFMVEHRLAARDAGAPLPTEPHPTVPLMAIDSRLPERSEGSAVLSPKEHNLSGARSRRAKRLDSRLRLASFASKKI